LPNRLAPEEKREEEKQTAARNTCHGSIRSGVARFLNPGIRVEREEEAETGCSECQPGDSIQGGRAFTWEGEGKGSSHLKASWVTVTSPATGRKESMQ
jgi:hypothetical protein